MLRIGKADYDLIRWEAERRYPQESVGIILGNLVEGGGAVTLAVPCENAGQDAVNKIHPEQLVVALKLARSRAETELSFYHSHPDQPSHRASTDLTQAHWLG